MKSTGARWAFISFPSGGERIAALLGGHVDMMIVDPSEARRAGARRQAAHDRAGERQAAARLPGRADLKEAGFDIPNVPQMRGVVGAPGMTADAVAYYEDLFLKIEPDAGVAEVPDREPARRRLRQSGRAQGVPGHVRGPAARHPERGRRQGGAVSRASVVVVPAQAGTHTPCTRRCGVAENLLNRWWFWVPACAGTTV